MKMCKVTGFIAMLFIGMGTAIGMDKNPYGHLLIELREKIMFDAINVSDSIDMAVEKVKSLASTDGALAKKINDPEYCLKLIKTISNRFDTSDETVAKMLGTLEAKRRMKLQDDLYKAIFDVTILYPKEYFVGFSPEVNIARIKDLIVNKGADVNFSDSVGRIPFYWLLKDINLFEDNAIELVKLFLQYGVDPETGKFKNHIQFVRESIDSLQQQKIPWFKQRKRYEEHCANLEKKLELYNTVLKMFEEAIAKKHARK